MARKSSAGRKPLDEVVIFKALVLQSLYNLSDDHGRANFSRCPECALKTGRLPLRAQPAVQPSGIDEKSSVVVVLHIYIQHTLLELLLLPQSQQAYRVKAVAEERVSSPYTLQKSQIFV